MTSTTPATETEPTSDASLLASVRVGEPTSCEAVVKQYGAALFHYLYWLSGDGGEAAVVFKDTMLHLYLNPSRVRKEPSFREWLYRHATQAWLQNRTQRQRQRQASLANILRAGLETYKPVPWADWAAQCASVDADAAAAVEPVVDGLSAVNEEDRAAVLLTVVAGMPVPLVAASLRLSPRKARKRVEAAFSRMVMAAKGVGGAAPQRVHHAVARHVLGRETPRQEKKFSKLQAAHAETNALVDAYGNVHDVLADLPHVAPPDGLAADTATHLKEGHAALETRIATWGFRFMQVTVPLFILAILAIMLLPAISRSREMARRAEAADNLRALGEALRTYSDSAYGNRYPPLAQQPGVWVPDLSVLYPRYIGEADRLLNPNVGDLALREELASALKESPPDWERAQAIMAQSYVYTGYALLDGQALASFMRFRTEHPEFDRDGDLETPDRRFYRLRQGVEQFFMGQALLDPGEEAPASVRIPVMFERVTSTSFGRNPEGANVLYLDGTVEFVPFGNAFPVNATVLALLESDSERRR